MGEYLPEASSNEGAAERNQNLPAGGVFTPLNLQVYHYAKNNPIRYTDPTGKYWREEQDQAWLAAHPEYREEYEKNKRLGSMFGFGVLAFIYLGPLAFKGLLKFMAWTPPLGAIISDAKMAMVTGPLVSLSNRFPDIAKKIQEAGGLKRVALWILSGTAAAGKFVQQFFTKEEVNQQINIWQEQYNEAKANRNTAIANRDNAIANGNEEAAKAYNDNALMHEQIMQNQKDAIEAAGGSIQE